MVTVITKTVGPVGRDYASPALAEAQVSTIAGGTDLVALDVAIVFEIDAAIYDGFWQVYTPSLNADATRNVTYRAAPGVMRGELMRGALITRTSGSVVSSITDKYTRIEGLSYHAITSNCISINDTQAIGIVIDGCAMRASLGNGLVVDQGGSAAAPVVAQNNLVVSESSRAFDMRGTRAEAHYRCVNNTCDTASHAFIIGTSSSTDIYIEITNTLVLSLRSFYENPAATGAITVTGTNNVGGSTNPFPTDQLASEQTWDVTTDLTLASDGNNAIYDSDSYKLTDAAGNDAIFVGTSPASDSDVPATDIVGIYRGLTTTNVGAFQRLKHIWTDIMATSRDSVDVLGVLKMGAGYINAKETVLTATGASGTDDTPMIPAGTTALWIQHLTATGAATDIAETCTLSVHIDASTSLDLLNFGTFSVPTQNSRAGFFQIPIEVTGTDGTYPFIRATNAAAVDATEVHEFRIVAIGEPGPSWS